MQVSAQVAHELSKTNYSRTRDLPRILPMWPADLLDCTINGRKRLVARLHSALRQERRRGLAGDWCYDLARHRQLLIAYRAERAILILASKSYAVLPES
jgi:hypothetical protein